MPFNSDACRRPRKREREVEADETPRSQTRPWAGPKDFNDIPRAEEDIARALYDSVKSLSELYEGAAANASAAKAQVSAQVHLMSKSAQEATELRTKNAKFAEEVKNLRTKNVELERERTELRAKNAESAADLAGSTETLRLLQAHSAQLNANLLAKEQEAEILRRQLEEAVKKANTFEAAALTSEQKLTELRRDVRNSVTGLLTQVADETPL